MLIIYYVNNQFSLISKIPDIMPDEINQLKYIDNSLYLVCPSKSQITKVDFPKLAADNRRKSILGGFDVEFIQTLASHTVEKQSLKSNCILQRKSNLDGKGHQWFEPSLQDGRISSRMPERKAGV